MQIVEPIVDFEARILCLPPLEPVSIVVDRMLRLDAAPVGLEPINLYLACADDQPESISSTFDFLWLFSVMRMLRSPVHGTALGILRGFEALLLASGKRGKRFVLHNAMASVGNVEICDLPLAGWVGLGEGHESSHHDQANALVPFQLGKILGELNLSPTLWEAPRILTAGAAITAELADSIVPIPTS